MNDYHIKVFNFTTVHYIKKAGISIGFSINKWQDSNDEKLSTGQIFCYSYPACFYIQSIFQQMHFVIQHM